MHKLPALIVLAAALAAAALAAQARPAAAIIIHYCPTDLGGFADPWLQVEAADDVRIADRDGDGFACSATLRLFGRPVGTVLTDNAIGNPGIIPPGPCTGPFERVSIGNPGIVPAARQIDGNGDGVLCSAFLPRTLTLILLDNPNAAAPTPR